MTKRRTYPVNCRVCGRFVPLRAPFVRTCGGGFTGEPLELVDALCRVHCPQSWQDWIDERLQDRSQQ